jgi:methyl-accepting chemotaxis protein
MRLSMQQKIGVWSGICLLVTAGLIISYSAITLHNEAKSVRTEAIETARVLAGEVGEKFAGNIKMSLEGALDTARTLAQALSGKKDEDNPVELGREEVNSILTIVLDRNPSFVGTYTAWEIDAFDDMDSGYIDDMGHDSTGRFIPYWNRNEAGEIAVEALIDYDIGGAGDYYQLPKKTKTESVIDPYIYPVQGKDTLITSLVVPILANDTFYGIAGIDLRLDFLQQITDNNKELYDGTATIIVISNNGTLAAVTGQPELVGEHMKAVHEDWEEDLGYIQKGEKKIEFDEGRLAVFIPIRIGKTTTPWCVNILIPMEQVTLKADLQMRNTTKKMWVMVAISGVCVLAALILMWFVARSIARPINLIIEGLSQGANQVTDASGQVSAASQSLAEGSSEQAASIEETSSSMEEMSSMTKKNSANADQADSLMQEAKTVVTTANESMGQLIHSMEDISKASEETSKIIKTIDEIAFQTNLLALNAAVEAARAGEAGAGFAVVADEVRNLAMRAADAAKNTAELIEGTVKKISTGSKLVSTTNAAFSQVAESTTKVGDLVSEISEASKEQSTGIEQVNNAIAEMDKVVQQNAANAEESASGSEEMSAQAEQLKDYVSELIILIKGTKEAQTTSLSLKNAKTTVTRSGTRSATPPNNRSANKRRMLGGQSKEITPDQVIPFDDDDSF